MYQKLNDRHSSRICTHCGLPVRNHRRTWMKYSSGIIFAALMRALLPNALIRILLMGRERVAQWCIHLLVRRGIVSATSTAASIRIPRARALFTEAVNRGIDMRVYTIKGTALDYYDARFTNGRHIYFFGLPRPHKRRFYGERWMDDKLILKKKLSAVHIPVPHGGSFSNFFHMRSFFLKLQKPVVVKPRYGSRGSHTTSHIFAEHDLYRAYKIAKQLCSFVVMEEHVYGPVYRGTVIDGKVVGILRGEPPRITGDGIRTVAELIKDKNITRAPLVSTVHITPHLLEFIRRNGYSVTSIIPCGITIDLSNEIGVRHGGTSIECLSDTHPELLRILENAAKVVDDPIIGFDFIIPDATKDPRAQHWGIIEANSLPYIHLHDEPLIGTRNNVAQYVWDMWK